MLLSSFPAKVQETLRRIATDNTRMEQYMDFVRNRMFRQTLLVHEGAPIRRNLDGRAVKGLLVASGVQPESAQPVLAQGVGETFNTPHGTKQKIVDALTKTALMLLAKRWPQTLPFEELAAMSHATLRPDSAGAALSDADLQAFGDRMLQGYAARVVELRTTAPRVTATVSARPLASPLARLQAEHSSTVTNMRHEPVTLPDLPRRMLPLLDGTRDIDALVVAVVQLALDGKIGVREQEGGPVVTEPAALERVLRQSVTDTLPRIAHVALLLE